MDEKEIQNFLAMKPTVIELTPEAFKHFVEMCDNPPPPTEGLKKLMRGDFS